MRIQNLLSSLKELTRVSFSWFTVMLLISTLTFLTKTGSEFSREWTILTFFIAYLGLITYRIFARISIRHLQSTGYNQKQVIIIGSGEL